MQAALLSGQVYNPRHPYPASSGFVRVTTKSADALKAAVHAQPVAIYLRAESDFHDYGGGVYDTACSGTNLNHGAGGGRGAALEQGAGHGRSTASRCSCPTLL